MCLRYIIRLDDASENMNREKWMQVCDILISHNITPIIAAIPFNDDPDQKAYGEKWSDFWLWIKERQDKDGWYIAIHGNTHVYTNNRRGILGIGKKSEFSGISLEQQKGKIASSLSRFKEKGLNGFMFVAPSHSFDWTTLLALRELGIKYVSDGHGRKPFCLKGIKFIPQQLWHGKVKKSGLWTICLHPNTMGQKEILKLKEFIQSQDTYMLRREINLYNVTYEKFGLNQILSQLRFIFYEKIISFIKLIKLYDTIRSVVK